MAPISKKRRLNPSKNQPDEITFDLSSRTDYLTGFHKRKLARKEHAREIAIKREKEEKVAERKSMREQRRKELEEHVREFNEELRKQRVDVEGDGGESEVEEEWEGLDGEGEEDGGEGQGREEDEFVDEEKYTTVTVEPMDMGNEEENKDEDGVVAKVAVQDGQQNGDVEATKRKLWAKSKPADGKPKVKKKKFRYETKAERQATRNDQRKKSKAARARREKAKSSDSKGR